MGYKPSILITVRIVDGQLRKSVKWYYDICYLKLGICHVITFIAIGTSIAISKMEVYADPATNGRSCMSSPELLNVTITCIARKIRKVN